MSILSSPEATPNRMRTIYQWLLKSPDNAENEDRLKQLIIPGPHNDTENEKGEDRRSLFVGKVLNEMITIGIVEKIGKQVQLSSEILQLINHKSKEFPIVFS